MQEMSMQTNDGPVKACLQGYIPDGLISLESGLLYPKEGTLGVCIDC